MHTIRMHTHRHVIRKKSEDEKRESKRRQNAAMRARNIAKGLTSAGKERKQKLHVSRFRTPSVLQARPDYPSDTSAYRKRKYEEQKRRYYKRGLNAKGKPLKMKGPALANLRKAQQLRRLREAREKQPVQRRKSKRVHFVYPVPTQHQDVGPSIDEAIRNTWPEKGTDTETTIHLRYCPQCGEHLESWQKTPTPKGT